MANEQDSPQVLNKHLAINVPANCVYIGRGSKWGNPFIIGQHGNRKDVIDKYREYIAAKPEMVEDAIRELRGKNLLCFCSPLQCHGDVLMEIANQPVTESEAS